MDQILVSDLLARGIIGVNPDEREKSQDILINLILYADLKAAGESDKLHDCINYRTVAKNALHIAETAKRYTVEALANDIADDVLTDTRIQRVKVRVEKPGAVRFSRSVGVEIERFQNGS
jgi:FolB domain-containing protein